VSPLAIIIIVVVGILLVLIVGGYIASTRRARDDDAALRQELEAANRALAMAHADDKGWERSLLEAAAREAFAERSAADVRDLQLMQVVDKPGTEDDQAVFRVVTDHGAEFLHLDRHGDAWVPR
jgi:type II secretory pathway pseudopilin PulG